MLLTISTLYRTIAAIRTLLTLLSLLRLGYYSNSLLSTHDCVQELVEERLHAARLVGFVETLGGRKRFLPHIKASGRAERARAERQVVNTMCQGSAADLIKRAMLLIDAELAISALQPHPATRSPQPSATRKPNPSNSRSTMV